MKMKFSWEYPEVVSLTPPKFRLVYFLLKYEKWKLLTSSSETIHKWLLFCGLPTVEVCFIPGSWSINSHHFFYGSHVSDTILAILYLLK